MNSFMTIRRLNVVIAIALSAVLTGCAGSHSNYASYGWSHEMSGDYLFAYDSSACEQSAGSAAAIEFFSCMEQLGYFQIDPVSGARVSSVAGSTTPRDKQPAPVVSAAR